MIYRSNLTAPDLQPHFVHIVSRPMGHSMGHDVLSDFADRPAHDPVFGLYKNCGFWTHDEAAILFNIAQKVRGDWLDIGCHTGWTTAHIAVASDEIMVRGLDPMLSVPEFQERVLKNLRYIGKAKHRILLYPQTSKQFFGELDTRFAGAVIDGDHCHPCPMEDAENALKHLEESGVVLFHDFIGRPVRAGVESLMACGFQCRVYWTPHMIACCWRGDVQPPTHVRDPKINWEAVKNAMPDFDFDRCA